MGDARPLQGAVHRQGPLLSRAGGAWLVKSVVGLAAAAPGRGAGHYRARLVSLRHYAEPAQHRGAVAIYARARTDVAPRQAGGVVCSEHPAGHSARGWAANLAWFRSKGITRRVGKGYGETIFWISDRERAGVNATYELSGCPD